MRDYGLLFVAVLAFGALAATFVGLAAIAGRESAARSAGYAAAVDSVRACERWTAPIRIIEAYGVPYKITTFNEAGRETSAVWVGAAK